MDTREHIKEVARELFANQGYDGVSVRDIIRKADVNLGAITYHFGSKEDLYRELIVEMGHKLQGELEKLKSMKATSSKKLEGYIRTFMELVLRNPTHARMTLREMAMGGKPFMEIMEPIAQANFSTLRSILDVGMRKKEFRRMDTPLAAFSIIAVCVHFINAQPMFLRFVGKLRNNDEFIEKIINHTVQFVLGSLKNNEGRDER
jgi:AcrR family transcriptional regulator